MTRWILVAIAVGLVLWFAKRVWDRYQTMKAQEHAAVSSVAGVQLGRAARARNFGRKLAASRG